MTKSIRIENADTSDYKVVVEVWEKRPGQVADVLIETHRLPHPTAMLMQSIWKERYLIVKEE